MPFKLFIFSFFLFPIHLLSQTESELEISLLTCSEGAAIYATFGHSAIRVVDTKNRKDLVFDFGVFRFDSPFFLWKFLKGDLNYSLGIRTFNQFLAAYRIENRAIIEERLNLSNRDKRWLYHQLIENYKIENRYYQYDFLFDNCSTRIRDLLLQLPNIKPNHSNEITTLTFRDHLNSYLKEKKWFKLGIDLLLGQSVDQAMTANQALFLPNPLSENLKKYEVNRQQTSVKLIPTSKKLLSKNNSKPSLFTQFTPIIVLSIIIAFILIIAFYQPYLSTKITLSFYLIFGLLGSFLLFMWLGTNHSTSKLNWNILWANPLYLLLLPFIFKKINSSFIRKTVLFWNLMLLLLWNFIPQQLNMAIIPLILGMVLLHLKNSPFRINKVY
jgi:hypothetical protein